MATFEAVERTSGVYTASLVDENGAAVAGSVLDTATLTLTDRATGGVINSRQAQDVLNANGVAISEQGLLTWAFTADDMPIVTPSKGFETHIAAFDLRWGDKRLVHDVEIRVRNIAGITT